LESLTVDTPNTIIPIPERHHIGSSANFSLRKKEIDLIQQWTIHLNAIREVRLIYAHGFLCGDPYGIDGEGEARDVVLTCTQIDGSLKVYWVNN